MATLNAVNFAKTVAVPQAFVDYGDYGGRVRHVYDEWVSTAAAVGDLIAVGYLDGNERVLDGYIQYGALGASTTLQLGDAADDDRYIAAVSTASAGLTRMSLATGVGYKAGGTARVPIYLKVAGATLTAGQTVRVNLLIGRD